MAVQHPNVGASGRRRIVPMMGIDFIAGDIDTKAEPIRERTTTGGTVKYPYGKKGVCFGGRTRFWSRINFMSVSTNSRNAFVTANQITARTNFTNGTGSSRATLEDLTVLTRVQQDWIADTNYLGVIPHNYATIRGWVTAVRMAQIAEGVQVTPEYTTWPPQNPG